MTGLKEEVLKMIPDLVLFWLALIFALFATFGMPSAGRINWVGAALACYFLTFVQ